MTLRGRAQRARAECLRSSVSSPFSRKFGGGSLRAHASPSSQGHTSQLRSLVLHAKAMPRSQLMGSWEPATGEWKDGMLSRLAQELEKDEGGEVWVVFDGDIDPEWAENLNSVLDDNHVLTLPTGQRSYLDSQRVKLIFETHQLTFASPATTSRYAEAELPVL